MGLIAELTGVFTVFREIFGFFPVAVKYLITISFGGMVYIAVLRSIRR